MRRALSRTGGERGALARRGAVVGVESARLPALFAALQAHGVEREQLDSSAERVLRMLGLQLTWTAGLWRAREEHHNHPPIA